MTNTLPPEYDSYAAIAKDSVITIGNPVTRNEMYINDDTELKIGKGFTITGRELKCCLRLILEEAKEKYPEELL